MKVYRLNNAMRNPGPRRGGLGNWYGVVQDPHYLTMKEHQGQLYGGSRYPEQLIMDLIVGWRIFSALTKRLATPVPNPDQIDPYPPLVTYPYDIGVASTCSTLSIMKRLQYQLKILRESCNLV